MAYFMHDLRVIATYFRTECRKLRAVNELNTACYCNELSCKSHPFLCKSKKTSSNIVFKVEVVNYVEIIWMHPLVLNVNDPLPE